MKERESGGAGGTLQKLHVKRVVIDEVDFAKQTRRKGSYAEEAANARRQSKEVKCKRSST